MVNKITTAEFREKWNDGLPAETLLTLAEPHCSYGPNYCRNVATSAALVRRLDNEATRFELALRLYVWHGVHTLANVS